jgi:hypothetical protein
MEYISHVDLINQLALRRMSLVTHEASFSDLEEAVFQLEEREALDFSMLKAVLAPYANTGIDLDEMGGPNTNDVGFDALDLIIETVCPDAFTQLELLIPGEDEPEEQFHLAWEGCSEFKRAVFFAIMELHFSVYDINAVEID